MFIREKIRVETYPSVFKCVAHLIESFNIIGIILNFFLIGMKYLCNFHYQIFIYHLRLRQISIKRKIIFQNLPVSL